MERKNYGFGQEYIGKPPVINFDPNEKFHSIETSWETNPLWTETRRDIIPIKDTAGGTGEYGRTIDDVSGSSELDKRRLRFTVSDTRKYNIDGLGSIRSVDSIIVDDYRLDNPAAEQKIVFRSEQTDYLSISGRGSHHRVLVQYAIDSSHFSEFTVERMDGAVWIDGKQYSSLDSAHNYLSTQRSVKENLFDLSDLVKRGRIGEEIFDEYDEDEDGGDKTFSALSFLNGYLDYDTIIDDEDIKPYKGYSNDQLIAQLYRNIRSYVYPPFVEVERTESPEEIERLIALVGLAMFESENVEMLTDKDYFKAPFFAQSLRKTLGEMLYHATFTEEQETRYEVKCKPDFDPDSNSFKGFKIQFIQNNVTQDGENQDEENPEFDVALGEKFLYDGKTYIIDLDQDDPDKLEFSIIELSRKRAVMDDNTTLTIPAKNIDIQRIIDLVETPNFSGWEKAFDILGV